MNVFYLKETARWSYIVKNAFANDIAVIIDQAMVDIEDSNPQLKVALQWNLFATLGAEKSKIKDIIDNVNQITEERFQEEDLVVFMNTTCKHTLPLALRRTANSIHLSAW